jgi:hypothetical protein
MMRKNGFSDTFVLWAIQIIRDSLGWKITGERHQMPQGGGRGLAKESLDIVPNFLTIF